MTFLALPSPRMLAMALATDGFSATLSRRIGGQRQRQQRTESPDASRGAWGVWRGGESGDAVGKGVCVCVSSLLLGWRERDAKERSRADE